MASRACAPHSNKIVSAVDAAVATALSDALDAKNGEGGGGGDGGADGSEKTLTTTKTEVSSTVEVTLGGRLTMTSLPNDLKLEVIRAGLESVLCPLEQNATPSTPTAAHRTPLFCSQRVHCFLVKNVADAYSPK